MARPVERGEHRAVGHGARILPLLREVSQAARPLTFDFFRREAGMPCDVGHQIEQRREIPAKRRAIHLRGVHRRADAQRRAQLRHLIGNLKCGSCLRPFIEHGRCEIRQSWFIGRIRAAAGLHDQLCRHNRQARTLVEQHRETVRQGER
jgi:hypothetical protein